MSVWSKKNEFIFAYIYVCLYTSEYYINGILIVMLLNNESNYARVVVIINAKHLHNIENENFIIG